jgi:tetratricopeptide (TPR) repeat protein
MMNKHHLQTGETIGMLTNIMRNNKIPILILIFLTALVYSSAIRNEFTNWDDNNYVTNNKHIKDFSWQGFKHLATEKTGLGGTRLTLISFMLDYKLWGLNPVPYHAENVLWHILNTILVYFLLQKLKTNRNISFITAALFALHPMHVESVAWISERKDVLYTFFLLLCLHGHIQYVNAKKISSRIILWVLVYISFMLSWYSKFSAVVIPLLLFLIDYFMKRRFTWLVIAEKLPMMIFLGSEVYRIVFNAHANMIHIGKIHIKPAQITDAFDWYDKVLLASYSLLYYIIKFLLPVNLSAIVPYPAKIHGSFPFIYTAAFITSVVLTIMLILLLYRIRKNKREILFGLLFFLSGISVFLHFVSIKGVVVVADRYTYVAYIGLSFTAAVLIHEFAIAYSKKLAYAFFSVCLIILCTLSWQRNKIWKNNLTLFTDVIEKNPKVTQAYNNRGNEYNNRGEYMLALEDFNKGIRIAPKFKYLYNNRALTWSKLDSVNKALADLDMALKLDPYYFDAHLNKANLLAEIDRSAEAIPHFTVASEISPRRAVVFIFRARAYNNLGDTENALNDYTHAIELFPENVEAYFERGRLFKKEKKLHEALSDFETAKRLEPTTAEIYNEVGNILNELRDFNNALDNLNRALEINPRYAEALNNRGISNFNLNRQEEALHDFNTAIEIDTTFAKALSNRGILRSVRKEFDLALSDFNQALKYNPADYLTFMNRGNTLFRLGRRLDACADWQNALSLNFTQAAEVIKTNCR